MNGIFIANFSTQNENLIYEILNSSYKNLAIFELDKLFSENEIMTYLSQNQRKKMMKNIILKFTEISKTADFVLVNGFKNSSKFDTLSINCEISRHLNLGICIVTQTQIEAEILKFDIENKKAKFFAATYGDKIEIYDKSVANSAKFIEEIKNFNPQITTPLKFEISLYERAAKNVKTVVLPESDDERILKAAHIINESKAVNLILLGDEVEIEKNVAKLGLNLQGVKILNPKNSEYLDDFANTLYELRKNKGMELEKAKILVQDRTYFGTMLVYSGIADAMVSGASTTTAETIRPALQIVKTKPGISTVSGSFIICLDNEFYVFADCAITPKPNVDSLAAIAISSADTAKAFNLKPKVAMLSYSTGESGSGEDVEFVKEATKIAKNLAPELDIDGPLQFDAAIDKIVAKKKLPNSNVAGNANVFIFPDLNCGNICYKAVQRTAQAIAIGPILQGLKKPINDLSRGCLVEDVVNTILISALQAGE